MHHANRTRQQTNLPRNLVEAQQLICPRPSRQTAPVACCISTDSLLRIGVNCSAALYSDAIEPQHHSEVEAAPITRGHRLSCPATDSVARKRCRKLVTSSQNDGTTRECAHHHARTALRHMTVTEVPVISTEADRRTALADAAARVLPTALTAGAST
jgi:hypothetical protein